MAARKSPARFTRRTILTTVLITTIISLILVGVIFCMIKKEPATIGVDNHVQFLYTTDMSTSPTDDAVIIHRASGNSIRLTGSLSLTESNMIRTVGVSKVERENDELLVVMNVSSTDAVGDTPTYPWVEVYVPLDTMDGIKKVIFQWYSLNGGPIPSQNTTKLLRSIEESL